MVIGLRVMMMVWCNNDYLDGNGGDKDGDEEGLEWQCTRRQ